MAKYGRSLRFGYAPDLSAADPRRPLHLATRAETLGLDYLGLWERPDALASHDLWTLLTAIGMSTARISLFTNLGDLALRPPALLAKAAATLALLTGDRLALGLNLGTRWESLLTTPRAQPNEAAALTALDEAIQVMRLMWSGEHKVRFAGQFQQLADVEPGPPPDRHIGIWLGVNAPHALALTGRVANGWLADPYPLLQPHDLTQLGTLIDDAATSAGRQPADIQRIWSVSGNIADAPSNTHFQGSVEQWAELLAELAIDAGIDTFVLTENELTANVLTEGEDADAQLEKFAREVVPRTREIVDESMDAAATGIERARQGARASGATQAEEETDNVDWVDETSMESFPASDPPASSTFT